MSYKLWYQNTATKFGVLWREQPIFRKWICRLVVWVSTFLVAWTCLTIMLYLGDLERSEVHVLQSLKILGMFGSILGLCGCVISFCISTVAIDEIMKAFGIPTERIYKYVVEERNRD